MKVKRGQLLVDFDLEKIKEAGYDPTVMVIITKTDNLKSVTPNEMGPVNPENEILKVSLD